MSADSLFATAGIGELSPEELWAIELKLLLAATLPFMLYCLFAFVPLALIVRWSTSPQRLNLRPLLALITLLVAPGLLLLAPVLALVFPYLRFLISR